jgi:cation:H+ antiporter
MLLNFLIFGLGLGLLIVGADTMVNGASRLAVRFGVTPLVIGLTVVAFGTSAPEAAVSIDATLSGSPDMAMGNVVGSNIFNILLILGLTALLAPLTVDSQLIRKEVPIMIGVTVLLIVLISDGLLSRLEAGTLLGLLLAYTLYLVVEARRGGATPSDVPESVLNDAEETEASGFLGRIPAPVLVLAGLAMLVFGGHWLVAAASDIARQLGVSDLVIGLSIVALGTSMPEAATSMAAVWRGQRDMAIGNAVGSNLMNILGCLGAAGAVSTNGLTAPAALLNFDVWVMLGAAVICLPIIITGRRISRSEGFLLLAYCLAYLGYTLLAATHHDALPAYSNITLWVVGPLTVLVMLRSLRPSAA